MVRWFRNTLNERDARVRLRAAVGEARSGGGCAGERAESHTAAGARAARGGRRRHARAPPPQLAAPAGAFALEQAVSLRRGSATGFAVLTKLVEQGPGFELYEFVAVT